jgi:tRNA-splicing ligase RtcB
MKVIAGNHRPIKMWTEGVEVEGEATAQLINTASMPFVHPHLAVMPDVHWGMGSTVGSVIPTRKAIIPAAVGVDIGCGMIAVRTTLDAHQLPDNLSALRAAIEAAVPVGFGKHAIDQGMSSEMNGGLCKLSYGIPALEEKRKDAFLQLGTLGGGNHFIELCLDEAGAVWIMLHSGSRGIGNRIGSYFIEKAKEDMKRYFCNLPDENLAFIPENTTLFKDYWEALNWAQAYAKLNRERMLVAVAHAMRQFFPLEPEEDLISDGNIAVNCHHNYVSLENHFGQNLYITRKGAVRARTGDLGIIPGSMGAKSFIVRGKGNEDSFHSCSHGAGRRMSRGAAKRAFTIEDHMAATAGVECRKDLEVLDETPAAYKSIDAVMAAQHDLVEIVHTLKQVLCVKG